MYAIIDCNSFYVSCERSFRPDLRNKPVVVLSNNDGCVVSRSAEAKKLGIPMAAPAFKYKDLFENSKVHVFSSNYSLYGDMSTRVMSILDSFSPEVEVYSIDEAFVKLPKQINGFKSFGIKIKSTIFQYTDIPTSIGIANTKALAKVANHVAKKFQDKTGGVYVIDSEEKRIKTLQWTAINRVWGIGAGNSKRLKDKGVKTAYDFTMLDDDWVQKYMTITGLRLKKDLCGEPTLALDELKNKKAIATTRSFEYTFSDFENLRERISTFAYSCAEKLRKQRSSCIMLYVFLRSNKHKKGALQYRGGKVINLPFATDSTLVIVKYAIKALKDIYKPGIAYKRAGVVLMGLRAADTKQLDLFENENPKHKPLMKVMDKLNEKFGGYKIKIANQDLDRTWKMKQEHLSPQYTSKFTDIIQVNCKDES